MRKRIIISTILMVLLLINLDIVLAKDLDDLNETAEKEGESYGYTDGYIEGLKNSLKESRTPYYKIRPKRSEVLSKYEKELKGMDSSYKRYFYLGYTDGFDRGYEEAYEKDTSKEKKNTFESGVSDGKIMGSILGRTNGIQDYFKNRTSNYLRNLPSDNRITREYSLNRDSDEYKDGFIIGFKRGYEEEYNFAFREANLNIYIKDEEDAYNHGKAAGLKKGELMATKDYMNGEINNWRRHDVLDSIISNQYNLEFQSNKYRQGFISGYNQGFAEGYSNKYKNLSQDEILKRTSVVNIPISGGNLTSLDGVLTVNINKGTYYNNIALSIEKLSDNYYDIDNNRFIKASGFYNIQASNPNNYLNKDKSIEFSFEYYGKANGGIYKRVDGKWQYINSFIKDGRIIANIKPDTLNLQNDNIYCILIDKNYKNFNDIRSHWAKDEINTLIRRNIINGYSDNTFKPEKNITKNEFLTLLSRVYNWGPDDNTFNLNLPISYREVEIIMRRVLKDDNFRWYNTSAKMLYDKQVKSMSYNNMDNKITRAEVVYMLYILNEWRY